jgi:hypothetical protein
MGVTGKLCVGLYFDGICRISLHTELQIYLCMRYIIEISSLSQGPPHLYTLLAYVGAYRNEIDAV